MLIYCDCSNQRPLGTARGAGTEGTAELTFESSSFRKWMAIAVGGESRGKLQFPAKYYFREETVGWVMGQPHTKSIQRT